MSRVKRQAKTHKPGATFSNHMVWSLILRKFFEGITLLFVYVDHLLILSLVLLPWNKLQLWFHVKQPPFSLNIGSFWVSKTASSSHLQKINIAPYLPRALRSFGFNVYLKNSMFVSWYQLLCVDSRSAIRFNKFKILQMKETYEDRLSFHFWILRRWSYWHPPDLIPVDRPFVW